MTNFSKRFTEDIILPDGSIASSVADVDKYLRVTGMAHASDYSPEYVRHIQEKNEHDRRQQMFADFLYNYKRMIWK